MPHKRLLIKPGMKFSRLTVIRELEPRVSDGRRLVLVRCNCNAEKEVHARSLYRGDTSSCGCYRKERSRKLRQLDRTATAFNALYAAYKDSARLRDLEWQLTKEQVRDLTSKPCHYTGRFPKTVKTVGLSSYTYNGIDRVDSSKGYTLANCVSCCTPVNVAKSNMSKEDFLQMIKEVYEHSFSK